MKRVLREGMVVGLFGVLCAWCRRPSDPSGVGVYNIVWTMLRESLRQSPTTT